MFLLPARALLRLLRRAELIPDTRLRERPAVASLAALFSLLGCAWVFLVVAVAPLTGELVLVGRQRPATR